MVNSPNSGCLLNIGNGPQSGPPLYSEAKVREGAPQFRIGPKAAKWPISMKWGQWPQSSPSVCNGAKYRKVAHHFVVRPMAAKQPISV